MDELKKLAAEKALDFIKDGQIVGLGTGSTTEFFIKKLSIKVKNGLKIKTIASSKRTEKLALENGLNILDINKVETIDIVVDGADQIDKDKNLIKGGGGALFREKILATNTSELIIIADSSKMVSTLNRDLPIEVNPFGYQFIQDKIKKMGFSSILRMNKNNIFLTDNDGYILDIKNLKFNDPKKINKDLIKIVGVVETGLFIDLNPKVIIAKNPDSIEVF